MCTLSMKVELFTCAYHALIQQCTILVYFQIFLSSRWIRLLFGREFPLPSVLELWDALFADGPSLALIDYVCVAMLMHIREVCKYVCVVAAAVVHSLLLLFPPTLSILPFSFLASMPLLSFHLLSIS